ncbi:hypothetical protein SAMN02745136_05176 [Anaerocolumna jejuensis DSM 15929]|uniref:Uncharacterized protein n=1 Tax=Anaerocolumna jejuensis DSM 15929 TaxID=1121322 RepID=A0A1M7BLE3_9FIRM|nr:hypothetical protein [Anaerocolumna jejuensis]SHL55790.1 hypothetical protein SAMN02745136_05176 [Anaerocolumna jejuensis DSM 15929]
MSDKNSKNIKIKTYDDLIIDILPLMKFEKRFAINMIEDIIYDKEYGKEETKRFIAGEKLDGTSEEIDRIEKHLKYIFTHIELIEKKKIRNNTNVKNNKAFKKENLYDERLVIEQKNVHKYMMSLFPATGHLPYDSGERWSDDRFFHIDEKDMVLKDDSLISILSQEMLRHLPKQNKITLFEMLFLSVLSNSTYDGDTKNLGSCEREKSSVEEWLKRINNECYKEKTRKKLIKYSLEKCHTYIEKKYMERKQDSILDMVKYKFFPIAQCLLENKLPKELENIKLNQEFSDVEVQTIVSYLNSEEIQKELQSISQSIIDNTKAEFSKRNHKDNNDRKNYKKERLNDIKIKEKVISLCLKDLGANDALIGYFYYYYVKSLVDYMMNFVIRVFECFPETSYVNDISTEEFVESIMK